jgi:hypothetical protein
MVRGRSRRGPNLADLRETLDGWFAEFGVPDELTITVRGVA